MQQQLVKVALKYGAIAGVLGLMLAIGFYKMVTHPLRISPFADFRIVLFGIFIFFALKDLRDSYFNGILYFWQGLIASFLFVVTFALLTSIGLAIYARVDPDYVNSYIRLSQDFMKSLPAEDIQRIGKDAYQRNLEELPSTNGITLARVYFRQSLIIGTFLGIIVSVIARRLPTS